MRYAVLAFAVIGAVLAQDPELDPEVDLEQDNGSDFGGDIQCNPARENCITVDGTLTPAPTGFGGIIQCNPARSSCITVDGTLVEAPTQPAAYPTGPAFGGPIQCNPARSSCITVSGTLVPAPTQPAGSAVTSAPAYVPSHPAGGNGTAPRPSTPVVYTGAAAGSVIGGILAPVLALLF